MRSRESKFGLAKCFVSLIYIIYRKSKMLCARTMSLQKLMDWTFDTERLKQQDRRPLAF